MVSRRLSDPAIEIADLPELDAVVLSHLHGDHFDRVASRELARDLPVFTTPHAAKRLSRRGFRDTAALRTWEAVTLSHGAAKLSVTSLPGRHAFGAVGRLLPPVMGTMLEYREAAGVLPFRVTAFRLHRGDSPAERPRRGPLMAVPVQDLKLLLESTQPDATLVHVEGRYVVAGSAELDTPALRGALSVVTREELLERAGGQPVAERDLQEIAAALSAAVDNRGG